MTRLDIERAEDIARSPERATSREIRDAFFWLSAKIDELLDDDEPDFEVRRYVLARHRLSFWRRSPRAGALQAAEARP